jgi:hypothetical protein
MILPRRKFLTGLAALVAAPAIVRIESLMLVRRVPLAGSLRDLHDNSNIAEILLQSNKIFDDVPYNVLDTNFVFRTQIPISMRRELNCA